MMDQALMKDHHPARMALVSAIRATEQMFSTLLPPTTPAKKKPQKPSSRGRGCQDARFRLESPPLNVHRQGMCVDGVWAFPCALLGSCSPRPWQRHPGRRLCSDEQHQQVCVLTSGQVRVAPLPIFRGPVGIQCPHICVHVHK